MKIIIFWQIGLLIFVYMSLVFILAIAKKDNSIVDIAWGLGFVIIAQYSLFANGHFEITQVLVTTLVTIWGLRLAAHLFRRKRGKPEDRRYKKWRDSWGQLFLVRSFFQIFMLQGFLMIVVSASVILINSFPSTGSLAFAALGSIIWAGGFFFESRADKELSNFISQPKNKGKLMTEGVWAYSRHPNYFGEATQWWGIFAIALAHPNGWLAVISPLTITFLLLKVSGVPLLEKHHATKPGWDEYARRTNKFIPWFRG